MLNKHFSELTFTVVDTETTGMSPKYAKLVEIAAVKILPQYQIDLKNIFSELINPEIPIPYQAYQVHKISNDMVKDKPTIENIMPSFTDFAKDTVIVGHNIAFDMRFIEHEISRLNIDFPRIYVLDTLKLSKKCFPGLPAYKLDNLIDNLNIEVDMPINQRHRAIFDAANTAIILMKCFEELDKQGICKICDI